MQKTSAFTPRLKAAIEALQKGEMVILIDSEDRENEGDLVLAAQFATPEKINFLITLFLQDRQPFLLLTFCRCFCNSDVCYSDSHCTFLTK